MAQLLQNVKAQRQAVLEGGNWQTAWHLTGLPEPIGRPEWAGSEKEVTVVSQYMKKRAELKSKLRELKDHPAISSSSSSEDGLGYDPDEFMSGTGDGMK